MSTFNILTENEIFINKDYSCWNIPNEKTEEAVYSALKAGYRSIDSAAIYGNEVEVGRGINKWLNEGNKREDIFVTSKLWLNLKRYEDVPRAANKILTDLNIEYLDSLLIHWPGGALAAGEKRDGSAQIPTDQHGVPIRDSDPEANDVNTWSALEKLIDAGKARNIGISNFTVSEIEELLKTVKYKPAFLQIELHPYLQQKKLVEYAQKQGMVVQAYSPFGNLNETYNQGDKSHLLVNDSTLKEIASKYGITVQGLIISFLIAKNITPLPKSSDPVRIKENFDNVRQLEQADVQRIESLDKHLRYNDCSEMIGYIFFRDEKDAKTIAYQSYEAIKQRAVSTAKSAVGK